MADDEKDEDRIRFRRRYSPDVYKNLHMLSPFDMLRNLRFELENIERGRGNYIWDRPRLGRPLSVTVSMNSPHMDIFDEGEKLKIVVEVPGAEKSDLSVEMEEDRFHLQGKTRLEKCVEHAYFVHCEEREKIFERELRLPVPVEPDSAKAVFKNDVLEVLVDKKVKKGKGTNIPIE